MSRPRTKHLDLRLPPGVFVINGRYYWQPTSGAFRKARKDAGEPCSVPLGPVGEEEKMRRAWAALDARYPAKSYRRALPAYGITSVEIDCPMVYFMRAGAQGSVKIGYTSSKATLKSRVERLQGGNGAQIKLIGVVPGSVADERAAHRALREYRKSGEWFARCRAVTSYIEHALRIGRIPEPDLENCGKHAAFQQLPENTP